MLNDSVFFFGFLIIKENIDDLIFLDQYFNVQSMSSKLLKKLKCDNKVLFKIMKCHFMKIDYLIILNN